MGCNCGKKASELVWVFTAPNGVTSTHRTEVGARAEKIRAGGGEVKSQPK